MSLPPAPLVICPWVMTPLASSMKFETKKWTQASRDINLISVIKVFFMTSWLPVLTDVSLDVCCLCCSHAPCCLPFVFPLLYLCTLVPYQVSTQVQLLALYTFPILLAFLIFSKLLSTLTNHLAKLLTVLNKSSLSHLFSCVHLYPNSSSLAVLATSKAVQASVHQSGEIFQVCGWTSSHLTGVPGQTGFVLKDYIVRLWRFRSFGKVGALL